MKLLLTWNAKLYLIEDWIIFKRSIALDLGSISKIIECTVEGIEKEIETSKEKVLNDLNPNNKLGKDGEVVVTLMHILPL